MGYSALVVPNNPAINEFLSQAVNRYFKTIIRNTPILFNKLQHGNYLKRAKQSAVKIQGPNDQVQAYCSIATALEKSDPHESNTLCTYAKDIVDQMSQPVKKVNAYCAIAIELAKLNPKRLSTKAFFYYQTKTLACSIGFNPNVS